SSVVIGGDNPGYQSVLGTIPESLVNPKQTEIFSKKICKLIDDSSYREKIYRAQQELVGQFDVNVVGQNLLNIYNDCIYRKKSR
ncbi:MAG: glycosyltransferase, partial [Candidatus Saccharimonadales bacterium]